MTFQFSIWDKFRDLENLPATNFANLVHLVAHLLKTKSLPLSLLKVCRAHGVTQGTEAESAAGPGAAGPGRPRCGHSPCLTSQSPPHSGSTCQEPPRRGAYGPAVRFRGRRPRVSGRAVHRRARGPEPVCSLPWERTRPWILPRLGSVLTLRAASGCRWLRAP